MDRKSRRQRGSHGRVDSFSTGTNQTGVHPLIVCKFLPFRKQRRGKESEVGRVRAHHVWPKNTEQQGRTRSDVSRANYRASMQVIALDAVVNWMLHSKSAVYQFCERSNSLGVQTVLLLPMSVHFFYIRTTRAERNPAEQHRVEQLWTLIQCRQANKPCHHTN